jgi:hypothetical protein
MRCLARCFSFRGPTFVDVTVPQRVADSRYVFLLDRLLFVPCSLLRIHLFHIGTLSTLNPIESLLRFPNLNRTRFPQVHLERTRSQHSRMGLNTLQHAQMRDSFSVPRSCLQTTRAASLAPHTPSPDSSSGPRSRYPRQSQPQKVRKNSAIARL